MSGLLITSGALITVLESTTDTARPKPAPCWRGMEERMMKLPKIPHSVLAGFVHPNHVIARAHRISFKAAEIAKRFGLEYEEVIKLADEIKTTTVMNFEQALIAVEERQLRAEVIDAKESNS
jgi:hypothetical protein